MSEASFDRVISDHLALCERNRRLEQQMPLDRYREQVECAPMARASSAPSTPPNDEPETKTSANAREKQWLDHDSFWDTTGERPLPEFDWGDG